LKVGDEGSITQKEWLKNIELLGRYRDGIALDFGEKVKAKAYI